MAGKKRWIAEEVTSGYWEVKLSRWRWFADFIQKMLDYRTYVFRGHALDNWKLESTLDRAIKRIPKERRDQARLAHLDNFRLATRGRRGPHPRDYHNEDEWWALGQHHGLSTPLLDWTESPFVALYFAFSEITMGEDCRAVWAISKTAVKEIQQFSPDYADVRIVEPRSDENARLVSQRGVFIRCPPDLALDDASRRTFADLKLAPLIKLRIPNKDRTDCLRFLNRMNINALTLFPDLLGASLYCNTDLLIKNY